MRSLLTIIFLAVLFFGISYWYNGGSSVCRVPMMYKIGTIDARFKISDKEARNAISVAESMWEDRTGKNLFTYSEEGTLVISFVFDDRQEKANTETQLKDSLDSKEGMTEEVRAQYDSLTFQYETLKIQYKNRTESYEKKLAAYNAEVSDWNVKGGAPADVFARLNTTKESLNTEQISLNGVASQLSTLVDKINALGTKANSIVTEYNDTVKEYNERVSEGGEFTQGDYNNNTIHVYQFDSTDELEILLAHELGHALGIDHVTGSSSVMFHLMGEQVKENGITDSDIEAFNKVCLGKKTIIETIRAVYMYALERL